MAKIVEDTRAVGLQKVREEIFSLLGEMSDEVEGFPKTDEAKQGAHNLEQLIGRIKDTISAVGEVFTETSIMMESSQKISFTALFGKEDDIESLKSDVSGNFAKVLFCDYLGQKVAVKIQKTFEEKEGKEKKRIFPKLSDEISILSAITHENIIAFRGWGEHEGFTYLVIERVNKNLHDYVIERNTDDNKGLSSRITWAIAKQIMQAMLYLHSLENPIFHGNLIPKNILIDTRPITPKPKICGFGFARRDCSGSDVRSHVSYFSLREEYQEAKTIENLLKIDVFAYGLVVLFMRSGDEPRDDEEADLGLNPNLVQEDELYYVRGIELPFMSNTVLGDLIKKCCQKATDRPTFKKIEEEFFSKGVENSFNLSANGEFFECGFLKDTQIFVANSTIRDTEDKTYEPSLDPPGYRSEDLICSVEVKNKPYNNVPEDDGKLLDLYREHYRNFKEKAEQKLIDDNPSAALAALVTGQSDDGTQTVELRFKERTYCHHRAMREVWRSFEPQKKKILIPDLKAVHPLYSTSFGLHVAILTNEGPGNAKKFVFTRRSTIVGRATPGSYTCGAVQRCTGRDIFKPDAQRQIVKNPVPGFEYISLLDVAARGLEEELGLPLRGSDKEAIKLNTIYLKFDNHEWGMCGFVDLTSDKVRKENQFSFEKLKAAFTFGPKDKFKHQEIYGVDFELRNMVEWIRENHDKLASSTKIVVVKVLQAFFGTTAVVNAFERKI